MPAPTQTACIAGELASSRIAKPPERGCIDQATWDQLGASCAASDANACYQLAVCMKLRDVGAERTPEYLASLDRSRAHLRVACDGGIAEACTFRVGVVLFDGAALPADACADLVRGCGLGDPDSCAQCATSCDGSPSPPLPAQTPVAAPIPADECCCPFASAEGVDYNVSSRKDCEAAGMECVDAASCAR